MEAGATTTTVRVEKATRDDLSRFGAEHDLTADEVIRAGLVALRCERSRKRAEYDAARLARDPGYLADVADVQRALTFESPQPR